MMYQNVIIFNKFSSHYHFSGDADGFFPLVWLSEEEIPLGSNSPESMVLKFIAQVIADRTKDGPKVPDTMRTTFTLTFFDSYIPISIYKSREFNNSDYHENDEIKVFIESTFGKIQFDLRFQKKEWQIFY